MSKVYLTRFRKSLKLSKEFNNEVTLVNQTPTTYAKSSSITKLQVTSVLFLTHFINLVKRIKASNKIFFLKIYNEA